MLIRDRQNPVLLGSVTLAHRWGSGLNVTQTIFHVQVWILGFVWRLAVGHRPCAMAVSGKRLIWRSRHPRCYRCDMVFQVLQ